MAEEQETSPNWLKLTPNLEHFDPFEGLSSGLDEDEDIRHIRYGISIAGQHLLIEKRIICEVIQNTFIYPIPNMPGWVHGMINLRGNLIPVIDLGHIMDKNHDLAQGKKTIFVIDRDDKSIAVFIDELPSPLELDESNAETVEVDSSAAKLVKKYATNAYEINGITWHEINHNDLFTSITSRFNNNSEIEEIN